MLNALIVRSQRGMTLVEFAMAVLVTGIITGLVFAILNVGERSKAWDVTYERMDRIRDALARYAASAGRLPCPADPAGDTATGNAALFGWEWGVTIATIASGRPVPPAATTCRDWTAPPAAGVTPGRNVGIVPFQTLGIPATDVIDGWGRYFTYAVSPVFAQINDDGNENDIIQQHCLDGYWHDTDDNINSIKAKFCCLRNHNVGIPGLDAGTDILLIGSDGNSMWPRVGFAESYLNSNMELSSVFSRVDPSAGGNNARYATVSPTARETTIAYAIVSHGANGIGAFQADGTRNRFGGVSPNPREQQNGAGTAADTYDRTFADMPMNLGPAGGNYYDDIVLPRTQDGVLADTGSSSCAMP